MAKRRKTIANGEAGAGLKCAISVAMVCEYEQKFISGIDPTTAFQDIINNIMVFGTSNASNYGLSKEFEGRIKTYATNPNQLVNDVIEGVKAAIETAVTEVGEVQAKTYATLKETFKKGPDGQNDGSLLNAAIAAATAAADVLYKFFAAIIASAFKKIAKYKIEIIGIANALSGSPSAPWHITLGNPLRPFFCSGDMLCESMSLKFGSMLAFNDLPSSIIATFTLTNARPLGMQEILAKFNSGSLRTANIKKDYVEVQPVTGTASKDESGTYFDPMFDQSGTLISSTPTPPGSTPSVTPPVNPIGLQPDGSLNVETITLISSTGPNGEPIISSTTSIVTLKDNGASVALLEPGTSALNLDPNQSVFNSFPVNGGPQL